jgi:hypothetical protein
MANPSISAATCVAVISGSTSANSPEALPWAMMRARKRVQRRCCHSLTARSRSFRVTSSQNVSHKRLCWLRAPCHAR